MEGFGQRLHQLRKKKRLSQKKLAALSGVSPSYLSRIERGERNIPHPSVLKKLCVPLGVTEFDLLIMAGYVSAEESNDSLGTVPSHWRGLITDPSLDEALRNLATLTDREKESLSIYLQALKLQRK